jgi:hypothetical protein
VYSVNYSESIVENNMNKRPLLDLSFGTYLVRGWLHLASGHPFSGDAVYEHHDVLVIDSKDHHWCGQPKDFEGMTVHIIRTNDKTPLGTTYRLGKFLGWSAGNRLYLINDNPNQRTTNATEHMESNP